MKSFKYHSEIITADSKEEAIKQIITGSLATIIRTGLKVVGTLGYHGRFKALIERVLDDMPYSKTEGAEVSVQAQEVVLHVDPDKNKYLTKEKGCFHIAKNLKRIVKNGGYEWERNNKKIVKELSLAPYKFTVGDCYFAYDTLLKRNPEKFEYATK